MQDVWHQGLKAHILDASNVFGSLEVVRGSVGTTLASVVNHYRQSASHHHQDPCPRTMLGGSHGTIHNVRSGTPKSTKNYAYLGDLSQSTTLFSEVDDNTTSTILCLFDSLFDAEDEIWPTGTDV